MVESEQSKTEPPGSIEERLREWPGDERARNELALQIYCELQPVLRRYLRRAWPRPLLADPAMDVEDIVQETLIRVFSYLDKARMSDIQNVRAWIYAVARNVITDYARRSAAKKRGTGGRLELSTDDEVQSRELSSTIDPKATDPLRKASEGEESQMLLQAVETLPSCDRAIIELRLFSNRTFSEIAEQLGISPATLRQRCHRAIYRLKEIFESQSEVTRDEQ
jgi:RNA polymerase sigma-70 factor, ECF subfamily